MMGVIVSVNVGLPRDVAWQGRTVRTAVWKTPVTGRIFARRLNLDGDGQGDLRGHGGEQRAIMVYQLNSYRYWASYLGRSDLMAGNFGENLTVEGLADNEVCIGDRFRIGGAVVEVSQPRDTCYRVGIRLHHPEIAALLVAHRRPGFYFRVIQEGEIGAGDRIEKLSDGPERMTVAEIDALLYSAEHPLEALRRAVRIPALSMDWQGSMQALLTAAEAGGTTGNAGLGLGASAPPAWRGFRPVVVVASREESADVRSFVFAGEDGSPLPSALPGQHIMVRMRPSPDAPAVARSYSLCGPPGTLPLIGLPSRTSAASQAAFSTKCPGRQSPGDQRSSWLVHARCRCHSRRPYQRRCRRHAHAGDVAWCGCYKRRGVSAGLVAAFSPRSGAPSVCQGGGRSARCAPRVASLRYLQSAGTGRHARPGLRSTGPSLAPAAPRTRDSARTLISTCAVRPRFLEDFQKGLAAWGIPWPRVHVEVFGPASTLTPGISRVAAALPHRPDGPAGGGPMVTFMRSGLAVSWDSRFGSLLELAEACEVPVRWSCRSGVCHNCESGLVEGELAYAPEPLDPPAEGNALICCATPKTAVELDL